MATPLHIFRFLREKAASGRRVALVTITGLTGASSRPVGTHMGIAYDGSFAGSFSGGCVEAAVVAEAQAALREGRPREVRFGAGSPYLDIRLPCGGGVDLLFQPDPDLGVLESALTLLEQRSPIVLVQSRDGAISLMPGQPRQATGWQGDAFAAWHPPLLKLLILGHGGESVALASLACSFGAEVTVLSPDEEVLAGAARDGAKPIKLVSPTSVDGVRADPWTAIVLLFHDHDWEPPLLARALDEPAFFVGAMGSRATHAVRLEALHARGVPEEALARIASPLGLIPSARDPATLALSALAQVVDGYRRAIA